MIDGIFSGLFGGLFGPAIAHWLSRFRYWIIFLAATLLTQAAVIVSMFKNLGFKKTMDVFALGIDSSFFYAPPIIGMLAVFVAFLGSLNTSHDPAQDMKEKQEP
jgi:hypothetical protein